jgi:hypothetical protein
MSLIGTAQEEVQIEDGQEWHGPSAMFELAVLKGKFNSMTCDL